jgi:putative flippase GtrA
MSAVIFVLLSGAGWGLDMGMFWLGVSGLGLPPGVANLGSATIAAMTVYAASRSLAFRASARPDASFFAYLAYTAVNIVLWAAAIQLLTGLIVDQHMLDAPDAAALLAKIVVTPFSLGCNFLVARRLTQRA